jgi:hypothetical protein
MGNPYDTPLTELARLLLDDQEGISNEAYEKLLEIMIERGDKESVDEIQKAIVRLRGRVFVEECALDILFTDFS